MECPSICDMERSKQHQYSESPVENSECICRGVYDPMHIKFYSNGEKKYENSMIKIDELRKNKLSFWRVKNIENSLEFDNVVKKISKFTPSNNRLTEIFHPKVGDLRKFEIENYEGRIFHVLVDCSTDDKGGYDLDHCTLGICKYQNQPEVPNEVFFGIRIHLINLLNNYVKSI